MSSYVDQLYQLQKIQPPKWLANNVMFEGITGSVSYGVSTDQSDMDIIGFCIPPKELLFPHLAGEIPGFGTPLPRFEQFQQHHIAMPEWGKKFDVTVYSIVKFFQLVMENNPNMVDALFLPRHCVLHSTAIYERVRDQRSLFLHKGAWHKFKGYAYSQMSKIHQKTNSSNPARAESIRQFGFDVKFAYHTVRLMLEVEQILAEGDLDLQRHAEVLKAIRRGEWPLQKIEQFFSDKERELEKLYVSSPLPFKPDETAIKQLLIECLELHYGNLDTVVTKDTSCSALLRDLEAVLARYR